MVEDWVQLILDKLKDVEDRRWGWMARCPAHEDDKASLSISLSDDGEVLFTKCHAGCAFAEIAAAIGMSQSRFFSPNRKRRRR